MFAVFAYIVYFTILWMLFVRDEPAVVTRQEPNLWRIPIDKPNSVPQPAFVDSVQTVSPTTALASSGKVAKDLNELGIRELRKLSKGRVPGFMRLNKADLIHALQ